MMPNIMQKTPPTIGWGIVKKKAPNLVMQPTMIMMIAPYWITLLLPTLTDVIVRNVMVKDSLLR